jgi:arabinofuranosyltransferase
MNLPQEGVKPAVKMSLALLFLVVAIAVRCFLHFGLTDDAYITFRYARNVARGAGFVYNEGERVLGTTTPLFTLALALPASVFGAKTIPTVAVLLSYAADGLMAALCFLMLLEVVGSLFVAVGGALLFVAAPDSIMHVASGMETSLFSVMVYGSLYLFLRRWEAAAFVIGGLAVLVRPEGILVFAAIFFCKIFETKRVPLREAALGMLVIIPWIIFATLYFGSPVSQSVRAKLLTYSGEETGHAWRAAREILTYWSSFFTKGYTKDLLVTALRASGFGAIFVAGTYYGFRLQKRFLAVALFVAGYCLSYALGNPMMFSWYFVPLVPGIIMGVMVGLFFVAQFLAKAITRQKASVLRDPVFGAMVLILFITEMGVFLLVPGELPSWAQRAMIPAEREETYRLAALLVKRQIKPGATVAANEVGVIGYYLDAARIVDVAGLISPEVLELTKGNPEERNRVTLRLLRQFKPDYIMSLRGFFGNGVIESEEFQQEYTSLATLYGKLWGKDGMLIFKRRS